MVLFNFMATLLISYLVLPSSSFFFFNDPATPEISPLPLPDPLPIYLSLSPRQHSTRQVASYALAVRKPSRDRERPAPRPGAEIEPPRRRRFDRLERTLVGRE